MPRLLWSIAFSLVQRSPCRAPSSAEQPLNPAEIPTGAPDSIVRTVTENCRTLKFENSGFEES